jgi:pyruvate formate lyase activating enzyme
MAAIEVDGTRLEVPEGMPLIDALASQGYSISRFPGDPGLFMPCRTGGCWACAVEADGRLRPACVLTVREGMTIRTNPSELVPRRLVGGFMGHGVGGVGTPWQLKGRYIEAACFTAGCNFSCPQCQNWSFSFSCLGQPLSPEEAAKTMTSAGKRYGVKRLAISGGECTLNQRWLLLYLEHLRSLNPGARLHVDTNGSLLLPGYLDRLVEAGMTDIGIDLKGIRLPTFMHITGLGEEDLALRYLTTAWRAVEHLIREQIPVFLGIGIPYNRDLIGLQEIEEMGRRILALDPEVQVCVLDYRPAYQRLHLVRPSFGEMSRVSEMLRGLGLQTVLCQTVRGRIGPEGSLLR